MASLRMASKDIQFVVRVPDVNHAIFPEKEIPNNFPFHSLCKVEIVTYTQFYITILYAK